MKAFLLGLAALAASGAAFAQPDTAAVCHGFCDDDAKLCRDGTAHPGAWAAAGAVLFLHGSPAASPDNHDQARSEAERQRAEQARQCSDARQVCRQKCAAPTAAPLAASAASTTP